MRHNELQYYTVNRLENARVDGHNLLIELRKETPESYPIMNIACAGPDEPAPDDSKLPQFMTVDYVRVYQKIPAAGGK